MPGQREPWVPGSSPCQGPNRPLPPPPPNSRELQPPPAALIRHETRRFPLDVTRPGHRAARSGVMRLRRAVLAIALALLAFCALGVLDPPGPTAIRAVTSSCTRICSWRPTRTYRYRSRWSWATCSPRIPRQLHDPGGDHRHPRRSGGDYPAVGEADQLRQLPRHRALPRLFAAAVGGDARRVRLQLAGALDRRRLPGPREDRGQAWRDRPGLVGRDRRGRSPPPRASG